MNTLTPAIERAESGSLVVTSETIAEGAGVQHKNVLETITKRSRELEQFGQVAFETRPGYNNAPVRVALLNEPQATLIMSFMKNTDQVVTFKVALVKGFFEMAAQLQAPAASTELSRMQILQLAIDAEKEKVALSDELEVARPHSEYVERFVADSDAMSFRTVASTLRVNESVLRSFLIACEWIYKEESERWSETQQAKIPQTRYNEYSTRKLDFIRKQEHKAPRFRGEVMHTLKIAPSGGNAIDRLIQRAIKRFGDLGMAIAILEAQRLERIEARKSNTKELF